MLSDSLRAALGPIIYPIHKQKGHGVAVAPHSLVPFYSLAGGNARRFSGGEVARSGDGRARRLKAAVYFLRALIAALRRCATQRPENSREWKLFRAERLHRFESKLRGGQGLVLPQWRKAPAPRSPTSASGS